MKRFRICLFLFVGACVACLGIGFVMTRQYRQERQPETAVSVEQEAASETETAPESAEAANRGQVSHELQTAGEEYYLVCEDGFLLVFLKDRKTICLYTHIPILEFPEKEQERLREGIWFGSMIEVFNYLESYTS